MLAARPFPEAGISDGLFTLTSGLHSYLQTHPAWARALLIVSSLGIDAIGVFLLVRGAFGASIGPVLALLIVFALRQICQGLIALPAPPGMIWADPGFPTLLVTYGVSTDLFFSAHTALAVLGAAELAHFHRRSLTVLGIALAAFEATTVIVLRAHYTMDVITGAVTALWVTTFADRLANPIDRFLENLSGSKQER